MDKLRFKEKKSKYVGNNAVGVSPETYEIVRRIAERSDLKMVEVANMMIKYAAEHVVWQFADEE